MGGNEQKKRWVSGKDFRYFPVSFPVWKDGEHTEHTGFLRQVPVKLWMVQKSDEMAIVCWLMIIVGIQPLFTGV